MMRKILPEVVTTRTQNKQQQNNNHKPVCLSMDKLVRQCFMTSVTGHYEATCPALPVLKSTNVAILKRKTGSKKNLSVSDVVPEEPDDEEQVNMDPPTPSNRSKSEDMSASKVVSGNHQIEDLQLVQACYYVIMSFMRDNHEPLSKGQNTHLFEATVAERRKTFINKKRLWKRSSSSEEGGDKTPSPLQKRGNPTQPDSGYDSDRSNLNKNVVNVDVDIIEKMTVLEKVQFITTIGLSLRRLRDEIYCQIIKQINMNPSMRSTALGWILLSLVAGCFPPSSLVLTHIEGILKERSSVGSCYCLRRLNDVIKKGERKNPPCSLELQAAKLRKEIRLPIICMDNSVRTVWVDSLTTVAEICQKVSNKNRLKDSFGFSIFFSLDNKVVPLGGGDFYMMDAITQAERYIKQKRHHTSTSSNTSSTSSWRIYFRREFFSPHDAAGLYDNYMKSWLTYSQVCGGVQNGEYQCLKSQDLALLIAHQYCIKHGGLDTDGIDEDKCTALCLHALPTSIPKEDRKKWVRMVVSTLGALQKKERESGNMKLKDIDVMEQIVRYASRAFISNFTKTFVLSSFNIMDGLDRLDVPKTLKLNHVRLVIHNHENSPSVNDVEERIPNVKIKSVEISTVNPYEFRIFLFSGQIYRGISGQTKEIVFILKRFVEEIQSKKNNESVA